MSVSSRLSDDGQTVEIEVIGRFDFSLQKEFRAAYRDFPSQLNYRVDLSQVEYLDSAALGMLLLLRQHAGDVRDQVVLCQPREAVEKILGVANFERIFDIV